MYRHLLPALAGLLALAACDIPPNYVENKDIDMAMARSKYRTVCKGLEMKEDRVRRYAADRLQTVDDPIAAECICEFVAHPHKGWDPAIVEGLKGTDRDELAKCFADLVEKPDLPNRTEAVVALSTIPAPSARATLAEIAADAASDPEPRQYALKAVGHDPQYKDMLTGILEKDPNPAIRAAAAEGITGFDDEATVAALRKAYQDDADGAVRGQALLGLKEAKVSDADALVCKAMMEDASPDVRRLAISAYKGTKRDEALACLRERAFTFEDDAGVRDQLLEVLKSSPNDEAAVVLCDAIPFWMKSYAVKDIPDKIPGTGIVKAQNDRDWKRSYECLQKAYRQVQGGGYSCYARLYVAWWFREYGGTSHVPNCPGYENPQIKNGE